MGRVVQPELLDELPFDDAEALRSRRDMRLINLLMGNYRWLRGRLRRRPVDRVVELGSGHGELLLSLQKNGRRLTGVDLAPRPKGLPEEVEWLQGDMRSILEIGLVADAVVVVNLLLHQFEDEDLQRIGSSLRKCDAILACEPLRSRRTRLGLGLLWPLVNRVTRHDGVVSIRAGFRRGELPGLLGLCDEEWEIEEGCTLLGTYRFSARRRLR